MDSRTQTRSEITACTKERDAVSWWPRDHPNVGVDGESTENVRVRSILAFSPDGHRLIPSEKFSKKSICPVMMTNRPRPEKHSSARSPLVDQAGQAGRSDPNVAASSFGNVDGMSGVQIGPDANAIAQSYGLVEGVDFG
jgi:hypothetical protein